MSDTFSSKPVERKPRSILDRLDDSERRPTHLKALFYGAPGTGKTYLIGTAPKVLLLDVDGGATTVRESPNVTIYRIKEWADLNDALYTLMFEDHGFEAVAIDTITTLQEVVNRETGLLQVLESNGDPRRAYAKSATMLRHKLVQFAQLPMHVIFTAHMRFNDGPDDVVDPEEGKFLMVPDVQPSVQRVAFALPDVIGRTFLKDMGNGEFKHAIAFGPDGRAVGKERNFGLPKEATGLTIPYLIKQVTEEPKKKKKEAA